MNGKSIWDFRETGPWSQYHNNAVAVKPLLQL